MKKIISLVLVLIMFATTIIGCGKNDNKKNHESNANDVFTLPDWMSGSDAARLLLANERLNAQLLKNNDNIFENGVRVMNTLAETAISNLNVRYTGNNSPAVTRLSSVKNTSTVLKGDYSGTVEISGDTFIWSGFEENNNSYDYFKNITDNIVTTAQIGAELIDSIKKNVRVVDKWVDVHGIQYYLSVDENSEMLCERDTVNNTLKICKRYKNEDGNDVYELYRSQKNYTERMTYIPGKRYELSMINDYADHSEDYFVADNSKGYWETYIVGALPDHYNVSYFIMKNDICYDAFYDPKSGSTKLLKIMSSDKATDILNMYDNSVDIKFSGFNGVQSVEAHASSVEYSTGEYANLPNGENAKVTLTNGRVLKCGDTYVNGKVEINAIRVIYTGGFGYIGEIGLTLRCETYAEQLECLKSFLNETGLQCRRNIDSVFSGINRAYNDLESVIKYYTWNGVSVINETGIGDAINKEKARFDSMNALYTAVKDAKVLDHSDTELIEMNIQFAPITESSFDNIVLDTMMVTVGSISLTIEDTTLYVENEPYKIAFALADQNGGLIHFDIENAMSAKYADEDNFTVTASSLEFTLPLLSEGNYTLVAYIATSEGIRASAYTPIAANEIANMPMSIKNMTVSAAKNQGDSLTLTYAMAKDFTVSLTTDSRMSYEQFKTAVSEKVFEYGIPSDIIEIVSGDTYTPLTGLETEIADGTYRTSYKIENGDEVIQGYIYVQYSANKTVT